MFLKRKKSTHYKHMCADLVILKGFLEKTFKSVQLITELDFRDESDKRFNQSRLSSCIYHVNFIFPFCIVLF